MSRERKLGGDKFGRLMVGMEAVLKDLGTLFQGCSRWKVDNQVAHDNSILMSNPTLAVRRVIISIPF